MQKKVPQNSQECRGPAYFTIAGTETREEQSRPEHRSLPCRAGFFPSTTPLPGVQSGPCTIFRTPACLLFLVSSHSCCEAGNRSFFRQGSFNVVPEKCRVRSVYTMLGGFCWNEAVLVPQAARSKCCKLGAVHSRNRLSRGLEFQDQDVSKVVPSEGCEGKSVPCLSPSFWWFAGHLCCPLAC